jgi:hypothetical protein
MQNIFAVKDFELTTGLTNYASLARSGSVYLPTVHKMTENSPYQPQTWISLKYYVNNQYTKTWTK